MIAQLLVKSSSGQDLSPDEYQIVFEKMLAGELVDAEISEFLTAWHHQGESATLLEVGAKHLRQHAQRPDSLDHCRPLIDNCGTGGSGIAKFNISTAAAILAASLGLKIAKHGNRASSGKCGSADLLFAAGFPDKLNQHQTTALLEKTGLSFFFAPNFHPVMKYVMPVRRALKIRTVFNFLGPLANPIAPEIQLLGVSSKEHLAPMAQALAKLGTQKALVVRSEDGLDEISPAAKTIGWLIVDGALKEWTLNPQDFGIEASIEDLAGGEPPDNLKLFENLLAGEQGAIFEAVALNTAALLWLAGKTDSIKDGLEPCRQALKNGHCKKFFNEWIEVAQHV